jgi:ABC-type multidrug transport system fused ATPase/permease subunit
MRVTALVSLFVSTLLALAVPIYFQLVIDKVLVHQSFSTLYVLTVGIVFALMFEAAFSFLRQYLLLRATNKIDLRLARRTFAHLLALPIDFFEAIPAGVTVRHMQQVERIRQFLTGRLLLTALDATALVVFLPLLFFYSPRLATVVLLFTAAVAGVVIALIGPFRRRLRRTCLTNRIDCELSVDPLLLGPLPRSERRTQAGARFHRWFDRAGNLAARVPPAGVSRPIEPANPTRTTGLPRVARPPVPRFTSLGQNLKSAGLGRRVFPLALAGAPSC